MVFKEFKKPKVSHERSVILRNYNKYDGHQYVAISPNGNWIVALNTKSYQIKLYKFEDLKKAYMIMNFDDRNIKIPFLKKNWSLTVSNEFILTDGTVEVLIAVSCFDHDDMKVKKNKSKSPQPPYNEDSSVEEADVNVNDNDQDKSSTFIIATARQLKIASPINNKGGIIKFLDTKNDDDTTELVLINARGITKASIIHGTIGSVNYNRKSDYSNFFYSNKLIEKFNFPKSFYEELKRLPKNETCAYFIHRCLIKDCDDWQPEPLLVIVIWDLFSSSDNCVRRIYDTSSLFSIENAYLQRLAFVSGKLIIITEDGTIISALEQLNIDKLLNPENNNTRNVINTTSPEKFGITSTSTTTITLTDYHLSYDLLGNRLDHETVQAIVEDTEPWLQNKYYNRTTVYLDESNSTQLIIGESTVQVWRKRKGIATDSSPKRILEYIWTNPFQEMQIQSLQVAYKEFSLVVYIPSEISPGLQVIIEWPDKVNVPVDACKALRFLDQKSNQPSGSNYQHTFENIIQQTENIIKKYIVSKSGLWRMLDIRYDLMAHLIRGNRVSIVKNILSFKYKNGMKKSLHIPRLYSWDGRVKETDLEIAIKYSKGEYRKDSVIVKYLLDYYSDNATNNSNWMFTVSKAIPLLYEYKLAYFVKELFQKPCFGSNEIYLNGSDINIEDIIDSDHKNIHALNIDIGLIKRNDFKKMIFRKEQR
ncbi:10245_t:CDS:2 [Funneliformis caledonium]|uniref:10245_t:CDS:1 n=1 Tax=Funneliformis caledonium TaxID=1117310 RepID=A0A9N8YPA0_9GLOM|nr:10245_t:CDS:2 [Funneliformis caledonium]